MKLTSDFLIYLLRRIKILEDERGSGGHGFNPANSVQIDPNETLRIPIEFQHHQNQNTQSTSKMNPNNRFTNSHIRREYDNVQYSPFINRPNQMASSFIPPDSPLIHVNGRLSLKSPSIKSRNYNTSILNSPYPQNQQRSKGPRPVYRRQS